jgi:hypothetical protein
VAELSETEMRVSSKPLRALEEIRRMRGGSQSHLMRCSDRRVLVNELLATRLATLLGLPTTTGAVIDVSEELIRLTYDLMIEMPRQRIPCQAGPQFGSRYLGDPRRQAVFNFLPDEQLGQVLNLHDFAGMLVFDKWTCNTDGRQLLFKTESEGQRYEMVMIDQGFCFNAGEWDFPDAPLRGIYARRIVYAEIKSIADFEPWLSKLENEFNTELLFETASDIPPEWYEFDTASVQRLLECLDRRRTKVRELLTTAFRQLPSIFPKWTRRQDHIGCPCLPDDAISMY